MIARADLKRWEFCNGWLSSALRWSGALELALIPFTLEPRLLVEMLERCLQNISA